MEPAPCKAEGIRQHIEQADADTLLTRSERTLTAERVEDVIS